MTIFIAELFISIDNIHMYTIENFLKFEWHDYGIEFFGEKTCEKVSMMSISS